MDEPKPPENNSQSTEPNSSQPPDQNSQESNPLAPEEPKQPLPHSPEFQQQLDQFRKAAAGPEGSDKPTVVRHKKIKLVPILLVILILALVAGGVYWYMNKSSKPTATKTTNSTVTTPNFLTGKDKYICATAAETAILCENVETKAVSKYEIPHFVGIPDRVIASPDGSKVIFVSNANSTHRSTASSQIFVTDNTGKLVKKLPDIKTTENMMGINWLNDSKSIVYDVRQFSQISAVENGLSQLYVYDLSTGASKKLTSYKYGLNYPVVTTTNKIIAFGKGASSSKPEELAIVSSTDGSVQNIDTSAVYAKLKSSNAPPSIFYSHSSNLFYANGEDSNGKSVTIVAKLVDGAKPKLVTLASYNKNAELTFISSPTVTSKGIVLSGSKGKFSDPIQLYNGTATMDLKLFVYMNPFTTNQPLFTKAESSSQLVKSDYLYEYTTPPAQLHTFLDKLTTDGCTAGQFRSVILVSNDGSKQAEVAHGDCADTNFPGFSDVRYYYVYENGQYKAVFSTKDIVRCKDALKYGISKAVLPKCTPDNATGP